MPTHYEYAVMNSLSSNILELSDWKNVAETTIDDLKVKIYLREKTKDAVIVFYYPMVNWRILKERDPAVKKREPNTFFSRFSQSVPRYLTLTSDFIIEMNKNGKKSKPVISSEYVISYTGFAGGAILAELFACRDNLKAVTFESPGCKPWIKKDNRFQFDEQNITCYLTAPNFINTRYSHVGQLFRLYLPHTEKLTFPFAFQSVKSSLGRLGFRLYIIFVVPYVLEFLLSCLFDASCKMNLMNCYNLNFNMINPVENLKFESKNFVEIQKNDTNAVQNMKALLRFFLVICMFSYFSLVVPDKAPYPDSYPDSSTVDWLEKQHSIDRMLQLFDKKSGLPRLKSKVESWPTFYQFINHRDHAEANPFIFFSTARRGIRTFFKENEVIEERIKRISGYKVSELILIAPENNEFFSQSLRK